MKTKTRKQHQNEELGILRRPVLCEDRVVPLENHRQEDQTGPRPTYIAPVTAALFLSTRAPGPTRVCGGVL